MDFTSGNTATGLGLTVDPSSFDPLIVFIAMNYDSGDEAKISLGSPEEAAEIAASILKLCFQSVDLQDSLDKADPQTIEQAEKVVTEFGMRVNASFN